MISDRIRHARIASGMTQHEVVQSLAAEGVSLTKAGLSKYERGGSTPKPSVLRALGRVLRVESSYFLEDPSVAVEWLVPQKGFRMARARLARVKALAESRLEFFMTLAHALEPARPNAVLPTRVSVDAPEDAETAAATLRSRWQLGDQPVESVAATIEDRGGVVVESTGDVDQFDGLSGWVNASVPIVVMSSSISGERRRLGLVHQLGHLIMEARNVDENAREALTHRFASSFLVSASTARRELGPKRRRLDFGELAMLKQKYGLSMQTWILRATDLNIIERSHARTLLAEMSTRGWLRTEPVEFRTQEQPQKLRQLTLRAVAEGLLSPQQAEWVVAGVARDGQRASADGPNARALLRLPKDDRDRIMRKAAALVADEYEDGGGLSGFESLAEGDHRDRPIEP